MPSAVARIRSSCLPQNRPRACADTVSLAEYDFRKKHVFFFSLFRIHSKHRRAKTKFTLNVRGLFCFIIKFTFRSPHPFGVFSIRGIVAGAKRKGLIVWIYRSARSPSAARVCAKRWLYECVYILCVYREV